MASMRQNIARALIKTRIGLTTSELSDDLQLKPAVISMDLAKMAIEGTAEKGEYLEGEGQIWKITEKGVETYGIKSDLEVKQETDEIKSVKKPTGHENLPVDSEIETTEMPLKEMEIGTFEVFQLTDNLASSFIKLMQSKQAKPIENIDYKIATLESLADIYNPKISATLREIVADLRG